jgi:RNA polymerase sigma-70 factor (ECF subfamily)
LGGRKLSQDDVRQLYDRHGPALVVYACSFLVDAAAAEDVVHQLFLRLLGGNTDVPHNPVAYVYRAVRNAALNALRDRARLEPITLETCVFSHRGGDQEAALALQAALAELPEEQREVVVMRVWSGLTLEEAATATGVSLNTVASRYRYALEKLRLSLSETKKTRSTSQACKSSER